MLLGKNIQKLRNQYGFSQEELANVLKLNRSTLANYEQGKREPNIETLKLFADFFNTSIDFLVNGYNKTGSIIVPNTNHNPISEIKTEEVVIVKVTVGDGTEKSPYMLVKQYWTKSGKFIGQFNETSQGGIGWKKK